MTVAQQSIRIDGRSAKYWMGGTGKPLILLHGGLGDARQHWAASFEALSPHFQIIAPDLPGFGVSEPLPLPGYQAYLDWLQLLLDMLHLGGPALMMGNSFGATLARLFTAENTGYIERLVLIDGGGIFDVPGCARPAFVIPGLSNLIIGVIRRQSYSSGGLQKAIHDEKWLTPEFIANAQAASQGFVASMKQIALNTPPALRTPTCPTLVVWGEFDRLSAPENGQQLAAQIRGARFTLIKEAAHMPQIEQPAAFHAVVLPFLSGKP